MTTVTELFNETKKVLAEYKLKLEELEAQEEQLKADLESLQNEMEANLEAQAKANVSEVVELKIGRKGMVTKVGIIEGVLEELEAEKIALKIEFTPLLKEALANDRKENGQYDVTELVEKYKYLMLTEIAEIAKTMQKQYYAISPDVMEIFDDNTVKEKYPNLYHAFNQEQFRPKFSWLGEVIFRNEVFAATTGNLPHGLKKSNNM